MLMLRENLKKRTVNDLSVFGGSPAFAEKLYVGRPTIGDRARLLDRFNQFALAVSVSFTIGLLIISAYIFRHFEKDFADFV
ncbi:MAG TPA: hypothetical protein VHE60_02435 [Pyrinomonadaceae bacterium]|nr:hypothetical protein [Pyrinomonadaceae bacterium]